MHSIGSPGLWAVFLGLVVVMLAIDLLTLKQKGNHRPSMREALGWSVVWVSIALLFNLGLWVYLNDTVGQAAANETALAFFTGYLIEKALAVDNIFVFLMIFSYFSVPAQYQRRVLLYGVLSAIVLRAVMILVGGALIERFNWILYVFGAFLLYTGIKMWFASESEQDLSNNKLLRWLKGHIKFTDDYHGEKFFVVKQGVRYATPLLLVLVMIEISDVIFAVDSIPAIFAVTTDPFVVITSNIFAILGLRAMYFLLADVADRFHLLKYGLALVLAFIGCKMLLAQYWHMPVAWSLVVIAVLIGGSIALSLWQTRKQLSHH